MINKKNVGIIVVNWNNYSDTSKCLNSLADLSYPTYQVTVVDNGSTDGSGERIAEEFEWCDVVFNEENLGFGGGYNTGIESALASGVDFVFLLNNDAVVESDTVDELVAVATESGAPIVGASIRHGSEEIINSTSNKFPDMFFYSGYRDNLPVDLSETKSDKSRWIDTGRVEGAGVLLTDDILDRRQETTGCYLDESLFMYCEEIELAMWCRKRGEQAVIATDAVVQHDKGASSSRAFQFYYLTRNRVLIAYQYLNRPSRILFDFSYVATRLLLAGRFLKRGQQDVARAILVGLRDGYRGLEGDTW